MGARKLSATQVLANKLTREGVPFRMTETKDGEVTIEVLANSPPAKPIVDLKSEITRRIREIPTREIRPGNNR